MKKQLPKIAIKYSKETFKKDKKKVNKLLRSNGFGVERVKNIPNTLYKFNYLSLDVDESDLFVYYNELDTKNYDMLFVMPTDFEKLKSYFEEEPNRGEVWVVEDTTPHKQNLILRQKNKDINTCFSIICIDGSFEINTKYGVPDCDIYRKATTEEEAKLIKAEHENGVHWDGEELIEIPKYVYSERFNCILKLDLSTFNGESFQCIGDKYISWAMPSYAVRNKSTKQAYEAQNNPKLKAKKWYYGEFNGSPHFSLYMGENWGRGFYKNECGEFIWCENIDMSTPSKWKLADMTKVKELLIKEAERLGFKEGVKFKCENFYPAHALKLPFSFHPNYGTTLYGENQMGWIFCESTGKWAEIIEEKEQHKTPSEAINSPKRLTKQVEKLERRVIELKEENERLKSQSNKVPIDCVTVDILDVALRTSGIFIDKDAIDKIIDLVELIEDKGENVSLRDVCELQSEWEKHLSKE